MRGVVKWFDGIRGYGFIIPQYGRDEIFVHASQILGTGFKALIRGQRVQFDATLGERGVFATSVRDASADPVPTSNV